MREHFVDEVHARDRLTFYAEIGLSEDLLQNGKETASYYLKISSDPALHRAAQEHETAYVVKRLCELWPSFTGRVLVNWGYVYQIAHIISFDHLIVFEADRSVWYERIRRAYARSGFGGKGTLTNADIDNLARAIEMDPTEIRSWLERTLPAEDRSMFNTSDDDWGAQKLREVIGA